VLLVIVNEFPPINASPEETPLFWRNSYLHIHSLNNQRLKLPSFINPRFCMQMQNFFCSGPIKDTSPFIAFLPSLVDCHFMFFFAFENIYDKILCHLVFFFQTRCVYACMYTRIKFLEANSHNVNKIHKFVHV
jgi:hypothetical protein